MNRIKKTTVELNWSLQEEEDGQENSDLYENHQPDGDVFTVIQRVRNSCREGELSHKNVIAIIIINWIWNSIHTHQRNDPRWPAAWWRAKWCRVCPSVYPSHSFDWQMVLKFPATKSRAASWIFITEWRFAQTNKSTALLFRTLLSR